MITVTEKSKCSGCYACYSSCPRSCIRIVSDPEGFWYPQVDADNCVDCGICEQKCPILQKSAPSSSEPPLVVAAINTNDSIRLNSSSGGIFTLLAEDIIAQGGVVFGAAYSEDYLRVEHICVDNKEELERIRGSKYVQSRISDTYKEVKQYLDSGRKVLFTGTPCQIGGLYSFLGANHDHLYTQDIICHGVPSPDIWTKYLQYHRQRAGSEIKKVLFRNKRSGWKSYSMQIVFINDSEYINDFHADPYMRAFLSNICLRPSCYNCSFKSINRQADITLADFWGVQNELPQFDDDRGTSLIMVHSGKGKEMLSRISHSIKMQEVCADVVKQYNSAAVHSVACNKNRSKFFKEVTCDNFDKVTNLYCKKSLWKRAKRKIKRLLQPKTLKK